MKTLAIFSTLMLLPTLCIETAQAQVPNKIISSRPAIMSTTRNAGIRDDLLNKCRSSIEYDSRAACILGIDLTLGAPEFSSMEEYITLMGQCDLAYPESGGGIESTYSTQTRGKNRASCRSGIIWTRDALAALE